MLTEFLSFGQKHKLFTSESKILLAISGGLDSVVMAHLFAKAKLNFSIAHCNFKLRGKESDDDEKFVKNLAKKYKVKFYSKVFDTEAYAKSNKLSIQVAARELRYEWFKNLCKIEKHHGISTAHHIDDSIETFFINLIRGTGIKGMSGIPIRNEKIIRPMLCFQRKEILSYAGKEKLKWREDSSNSKQDYLRNQIRLKLGPVLFQLQPELHSIMTKNFENLRDSILIQNEFTDLLCKKFLSEVKADSWKINTELLKKEENSIIKLQLVLEKLNIRLSDSSSLLVNDSPGKIFHSGDFRILRDRKFLRIERNPVSGNEQIEILAKDKRIQANNLTILIKNELFKRGKLILDEPTIHQIDIENLIFPLLLRRWNAGDYFIPLGMRQKKKLSDFLIDNKVDRFEKENCYVLLSGNDIVCILGHRIDDRYKITDKTKRILTLTLKYNPIGSGTATL